MPFGIYIHIPFCSRRCDYCDFATWVGREALVEEYVETILRQFKFQMEYFNIEPSTLVDSIFFGGGTPNLIDESHLAKIISTISSKLSVSSDTEITVECNPDHVTSGQMETYKHAGVNRISIGVQSSNHKVLEYLGREHNPIHVKTARDHIASSGITNVSADLIYGSPCESFKEWEDSLDFTIGLDLNHISAYALGIESGTPLANSITAEKKQTSATMTKLLNMKSPTKS
jgi:oxygen-independent coproporphyrinogen-3 oxidase